MVRDGHTVSVIVPTVGRATLAECEASLRRQTRLPDEIIIVRDDERRGASWARNEGLRRARGDLIAFADDDLILPSDWVERLVAAIDRFDAAGAGGPYQETDPLLHEIRARRRLPRTEQLDPGGLVGAGGNVMFRRSWLDACAGLGGRVYDEAYIFAQDWELVLRLRLRGAKLVFVPAPAVHLRRVTPLQYLRFQFARGRAIAMLRSAHQACGMKAAVHDSLLWGSGPRGRRSARWLAAIWRKAVGPFDRGSFSTRRHFWLFWLGEKFQGAGFLWDTGRRAYRGP